MKNVTLSAEEGLIQNARHLAEAQKTTLNQMFRDWLAGLSRKQEHSHREEVEAIFRRLDHVNAGRKFSREEMNAR